MSVIGVVMVYSASANIALQNGGSPLSYLIKQLIYMVVGLGIILFMIRMNINFLRKPIVLKFLLGLFVLDCYGCWCLVKPLTVLQGGFIWGRLIFNRPSLWSSFWLSGLPTPLLQGSPKWRFLFAVGWIRWNGRYFGVLLWLPLSLSSLIQVGQPLICDCLYIDQL